MRKITLAIIAGFFPATGAFAQSGEPLREGHLDLLDQNDSGAINRTEYQQFMSEAFTRLDTGASGYIVETDIAGILSSAQFMKLDMNGDGRVSRDEFMAQLMSDFELADKDRTSRLE